MRITGEWFVGSDGVTVPTVEARFPTADGRVVSERFLIDSGADRTVFTARLVGLLGVSDSAATIPLDGVGGSQRSVPVPAAFQLRREDDTWVTFRGQYAGLLDPTVFDLSLLGRDVLDFFDVILSRRRSEVLLLAGNHAYTTAPAV